jgi:hypothetical protein
VPAKWGTAASRWQGRTTPPPNHASPPMKAATRTMIHSDQMKCQVKKWTLIFSVFWIMKMTSAAIPMSETITPPANPAPLRHDGPPLLGLKPGTHRVPGWGMRLVGRRRHSS